MLIAGGFEAAGNNAIGGIIDTVIINNTIISQSLADTVLESGGLCALVIPSIGSGSSDKKKKIRGIAIEADEKVKSRIIGISGAGSGNVAITGVINTVVSSSKVHATARGKTTAKTKQGATVEDGSVPLQVLIYAYSDTDVIDAAGSLAASGNTAVGAAIVVMTYAGDVQAISSVNDSDIPIYFVEAYKNDKLFLVAISGAGSGSVAISGAPNILVYKNRSNALIEGKNRINGTITVRSTANTAIDMISAVLTGSGAVAVSLAGNVLYLQNISEAKIGDGTSNSGVKADTVTVESITSETLNADCAGLAGSGSAAVGGAADIIITNVKSDAIIGKNIQFRNAYNLTVRAKDDYSFYGIVGTLAASGAAGVGVSAIVAVTSNEVKAQIQDNTVIECGALIVEAIAGRQVQGFSADVAAAGAAGIGASVIVFVTGKGIDQASYDTVFKNGKINPEKLIGEAYQNADKRGGTTAGESSVKSGVNEAIKPNKSSAVDVAKKASDNGDFATYGNGNTKLSNELADKTSANISAGENDGTAQTLAHIGKGVKIECQGADIKASENVSVVAVSGGLGVGGTAGIGASVAVVIVGSNIKAHVDESAYVFSGNYFNITSELTHNNKKWKSGSSYSPLSGVKILLSDVLKAKDKVEKDNTSEVTGLGDYGILVIGAAAAGGYVGAAANIAYFNNSAKVESLVNGKLEVVTRFDTRNNNIKALADTGKKGVFLFSVAGGLVGAAANVAIITAETIVNAIFDSSADANKISVNELNITSEAKGDLVTINAAIAAGAVGAAVTVSIANNRISANAAIGGATKIVIPNRINVKSRVNSNVKTYIGSVAVGGIGATVAVSIANHRPESSAYVGRPNDKKTGSIEATGLSVESKVEGDVYSRGIVLSAGGVAANGAVVLAIRKATSIAAINPMKITIKGGTVREVKVNSFVDGIPESSVKVEVLGGVAGAIGVGAIVAMAYIDSASKAYIDTDTAEFTADSVAVSAKGLSGSGSVNRVAVSIVTGAAGLATGAFNYAYAENDAKHIAYISTRSTNFDVRTVDVQAQAVNTAVSLVANAAVAGITSNVSSSKVRLGGESTAEFKSSGNARIKAGTINVFAKYNDKGTEAPEVSVNVAGKIVQTSSKAAAEAWLISGAAALASKASNVVEAVFEAKTTAGIEFNGGTVTVSDTLKAEAAGNSSADACAENNSSAPVSAGVTDAKATAAGTNKAYIINLAKESKLDLKKVEIINNFISKAYSNVYPAKSGVSSSVVEAVLNQAVATASTHNSAYGIGGFGTIKNNLTIRSEGTAEAKSRIYGAKIDVAGAKLAGNFILSDITVTNEAYYDGRGKEITAGNVEVIANIKDSYSTAQGGASTSGLKLALLSGGLTSVSASSNVTSDAYITNTNITASNNAKVSSIVKNIYVNAIADAPDYSIGVSSAQVVETKTNDSGKVKAYVGGNSAITAKGFNLISQYYSTVKSIGSAPRLSVQLSSGDSVHVVTEVSKDNDRSNVAQVKEGSRITTTKDDLNIIADSSITAETSLNPLKNIGALQLGTYYLGVSIGKTRNAVEIDGNLSSMEKLNIEAKDRINGVVHDVEVINGGLLGGTTSKVVGTVSGQVNEIIIGTDGGKESVLYAEMGQLLINAITSGNLTNKISSSSYGAGTKSNIVAENTYKHSTQVAVKDNCQITSGGNNIAIQAIAEGVNAYSTAVGTAGGGIQKAIPTAKINEEGNTKVDIGGGVVIATLFGKVDIIAKVISELKALAEYTMSGGIENNQPVATIGSTENICVNIAVGKDKQTVISGSDVEIAAYVQSVNHEAKARAITKSFACYTEANSKLNPVFNLNINIGNADISGFDTLYVFGLIKNLNEDSISYAEISGVTGKVYSYAELTGSSTSNVYIGDSKHKAILRSPDVFINNEYPDNFDKLLKRSATASGKTIINKVTKTIRQTETVVEKVTKWLPWPLKNIVKLITKTVTKIVTKVIDVITYSDAKAEERGTYNKYGDMKFNMDLYAGQYGAGININIAENGKVTTSGLSKKDIEKCIKVGKDAIRIEDIQSSKNGKVEILAAGNKASGTITLYNTSYISSLNITSYSRLPIYIKNVNMLGVVDMSKPLTIKIPVGVTLNYGIGSAPKATITTYGGSDVTFDFTDGDNARDKDFNLGEGSLLIYMRNGGNVYTASRNNKNAFVAANAVEIYGADNIGSSMVYPFVLFLIDAAPINTGEVSREGRAANLSIYAGNNVFLRLSPTRLQYNSHNEDLGAGTYNINALVARNISFDVTRQYYTLLTDDGKKAPEKDWIAGLIKLFRPSNFDAIFWFGTVKADEMTVFSNPFEGAYYFNQQSGGSFDVKKLIKFLNGRSYWNITNDPTDNSDGGGGSPSSPINQIIKEGLTSPIRLLNPKDRDAIKKLVNKNRKQVKHDFIAFETRRSGNYRYRNYRFFDDIDRNQDYVSPYAMTIAAADLFLIVYKDGWSYIIAAKDALVSDMIKSVCKDSDSKAFYSKSLLSSVAKALSDESMIRFTEGMNYLLVIIPIIVLLLLFLFVTRRKKDEEEENA